MSWVRATRMIDGRKPLKKITTNQFAGIGEKRAIDKNLNEQGQKFNSTLEKLARWERLLKPPA